MPISMEMAKPPTPLHYGSVRAPRHINSRGIGLLGSSVSGCCFKWLSPPGQRCVCNCGWRAQQGAPRHASSRGLGLLGSAVSDRDSRGFGFLDSGVWPGCFPAKRGWTYLELLHYRCGFARLGTLNVFGSVGPLLQGASPPWTTVVLQ